MNRFLSLSLITLTALSIQHSTAHAQQRISNTHRQDFAFSQRIKPKDVRIDLEKLEVFLNLDQTYESLMTYEKTVLTAKGISAHQTMSSPSYFPGHSSVELIEAYTLQTDGKRIDVPKENLFITTSPSDPAAPGFITSLQQNIAFPHVKIGSKLHAKWSYKQLNSPPFNFADVVSPSFENDSLHTEMSVNLPESMPVKWAKEGDFEVKESLEGGRRLIRASIGSQPGKQKEPFMPDSSDLLPFFELSTITSWEEIGNTISKLTLPSQTITPEIKALAKKIVGTKKGKEAVEAIYNWTATQIAYLETAINPRQCIIPLSASEVISNRFGDCKGHSCVLQTLLKVMGIESYPVLVNWDASLKQYPLPILNFDHEMVFIPSLNLFLNPTDPYSPFNTPLEETNFSSENLQVLSNKPALIAKPIQSVLTTTPPGLPEKNRYQINNRMRLNLNGDIQTKGSITATGCFAELARKSVAEEESIAECTQMLLLKNGIKADVLATEQNPQHLDAPLKIDYTWEAMQIAELMNEQIQLRAPIGVDFFSTEFFSQFLSTSLSRCYPLIIGATVYDWNYSIELPIDYKVGKPPGDKLVSNAAGSYRSTYKTDDDLLRITRTLTLNKTSYSAEEYPDVAILLTELLKDRDTLFSFVQK